MVSLLVSNVARSGSCTLPPRQDLSARAPCKRPTCGASQTLPLPGHRQPHTDSHSYEFKFCLSTSPHSFSYETCRATTSTRLEKPLSSVLRLTVLRPPDPSYPVTRLYSWFLITALPRTNPLGLRHSSGYPVVLQVAVHSALFAHCPTGSGVFYRSHGLSLPAPPRPGLTTPCARPRLYSVTRSLPATAAVLRLIHPSGNSSAHADTLSATLRGYLERGIRTSLLCSRLP